jgi:hypothetical protein
MEPGTKEFVLGSISTSILN